MYLVRLNLTVLSLAGPVSWQDDSLDTQLQLVHNLRKHDLSNLSLEPFNILRSIKGKGPRADIVSERKKTKVCKSQWMDPRIVTR